MSKRPFIPNPLFWTYRLPSKYYKEVLKRHRQDALHTKPDAYLKLKNISEMTEIKTGGFFTEKAWKVRHSELVKRFNLELGQTGP